jgi:hypothetical protein
MLFSLPIDLLRVVFDYFNLKDFAQLDRSILSHSVRPIFTEALTGYEVLSIRNISCTCLLLEWLTSRRILITSVTLSEYSSSIAQDFIAGNRSCLQSMKFLEDCNEDLDDSVFTHLKECQNLNTISFESCDQITDKGLVTLLQNEFFSLKTLELSDCSSLTTEIATVIASRCSQLQHLNLSGCGLVADANVEAILRGCPILLSLDLSKTSISEASVRQVLTSYPNLQSLGLTDCENVSHATKVEALRRISLRAIQNEVRQVQLFGVRCLRKALSDGDLHSSFSFWHLLLTPLFTESDPPIGEVVSLGVVPRLILFLSYGDSPVGLLFPSLISQTRPRSYNTKRHGHSPISPPEAPFILSLLLRQELCQR